MAPVSCFDVAKYILEKNGRMTAMKLQKLVYYCQAWSLVWDEKPLFKEKIEAWAYGPVVRELYEYHRGAFEVVRLRKGDTSKLSDEQRETIDAVLRDYGKRTAQWLSDLSHMEDPWNDARTGLPEGASCENEITLVSMHEYYSSLPADYLLS
ncbi:MAG: DUF4065 domain-containing protein [Dehalococcoidia bacterium]|nr:DUF4065 domain-containing protein [Dehalococcoidia bacterium]